MKTIHNPLTVIAIFSGISEIGGVYVLPKISDNVQVIYVWFLVLFPVFLAGAFFWVLYKKPECLYAPCDFASPDAMKAYRALHEPRRSSESEVNNEVIKKIESATNDQPTDATVIEAPTVEEFKSIADSGLSYAERVFGLPNMEKNVAMPIGEREVFFDGYARLGEEGKSAAIVELRYVLDPKVFKVRSINSFLIDVQSIAEKKKSDGGMLAVFFLFILKEESQELRKEISDELSYVRNKFSMPIVGITVLQDKLGTKKEITK